MLSCHHSGVRLSTGGHPYAEVVPIIMFPGNTDLTVFIKAVLY